MFLNVLIDLVSNNWEAIVGILGSIGTSLLAIKNKLGKVDKLENEISAKFAVIESDIASLSESQNQTDAKLTKLEIMSEKLDKIETTIDTYIRKEESILKSVAKIDHLERDLVKVDAKLDLLLNQKLNTRD